MLRILRMLRPHRPLPRHDVDEIALRQVRSIKNIANKHLKSTNGMRRPPQDLAVVVPYEDLLQIWNLADQLRWRL